MAYGSQKPRGKKSAVYGELVVPNGRGLPVPVDREASPFDKGGFAPTQLDPVIQTLIDNAQSGAALLQTYTPMLEAVMNRLQEELGALLEAMPAPLRSNGALGVTPGVSNGLTLMLDMSTKVAAILEKVNRMMQLSVKAKDDATRLRAFLATGDEDDKGLESMSDDALRKMVTTAASGFAKPDDL